MTKNNQPTSTSVSPGATKESITALDEKVPEPPLLGTHIARDVVVVTATVLAAAVVVAAVPVAAPALVGQAAAVELMVPALAGPANVVIAGVIGAVIPIAAMGGGAAITVAAVGAVALAAASLTLISEEKAPTAATLIAFSGKALTAITAIAAEPVEGIVKAAAAIMVSSSIGETIIVVGESGAFGRAETEPPYDTLL